MRGDFSKFVSGEALIADVRLPIEPLVAKAASSMAHFHPIRHRAGVVLVCLVALLTAREGWNTRVSQHPTEIPTAAVTHAPPTVVLQKPRFDFGVDRQWSRENVLRPVCMLQGKPALPSCEVMGKPFVAVEPELIVAVNLETFPIAASFRPGIVPVGDAAIDESLLDALNQVEPLQPVSYLLWLPTVHRCRNLKKDMEGKDYCAPEDATAVPEPGSVWLAFTGAAAVLAKRRWRA